jgi:hypothetical protein
VSALALALLEAELDEALSLGARALAWSEAHVLPLLASAATSVEALLLGRLQRSDTLRQRSAARFDVPLRRRASTGTEAQLSGPLLYHALALPRVDALFADASSRTLLNRNLRAFLRGYAAAGIPLRYFGTEVLALLGHPVALVGYDQTPSGAVLIEVFVGLEQPCVVRPALQREPPRALASLLRDARASTDQAQRAQLYRAMQAQLAEDAPLLFFQFDAIIQAAASRLHWTQYPDGGFALGDAWLEG